MSGTDTFVSSQNDKTPDQAGLSVEASLSDLVASVAKISAQKLYIPRTRASASSIACNSPASRRPAEFPRRSGSTTVVCSTRTLVGVFSSVITGLQLAGKVVGRPRREPRPARCLLELVRPSAREPRPSLLDPARLQQVAEPPRRSTSANAAWLPPPVALLELRRSHSFQRCGSH